MITDMITAANKIASDKLHQMEYAEILRLRRELAEIRSAVSTEIEIEHGRFKVVHQ